MKRGSKVMSYYMYDNNIAKHHVELYSVMEHFETYINGEFAFSNDSIHEFEDDINEYMNKNDIRQVIIPNEYRK